MVNELIGRAIVGGGGEENVVMPDGDRRRDHLSGVRGTGA